MEMRNRILRKLFWGGVIVLIGVCYLLFNIGILPLAWKPIVLSWQALLVLLGCAGIIHRHYFWGFVAVPIGIFYLLPQLSVVMEFNYSEEIFNNILWPVVIILIGILVMSHSIVHHRHTKYWKEFKEKHQFRETDYGTDGKIKYDYILNGIDEIFLGPIFRGGEINVVLGGIKLDLRRSSLPEGDVVLKMSAVCGGINLLIPQDWPVEIHSQSLLSGFEDKRGTNGIYVDRKLIIILNSILSGGEIKC